MTWRFKKYALIPFLLLVVAGLCLRAEDKIDPEMWQRAMDIHREAIVVDTHTDTPMLMLEQGLDIGKRSDRSEVDLVKMKEGGLDAAFLAVFVSNRLDKKHPARRALEAIDEIYRQVEANSDLAELALSVSDIRRIHRADKRVVLIGMENGGPIEGSLRLLRNFYRLGIRYITLTHNDNNDICDSSSAEQPRWKGLSVFGKQVVREMNRLGMLIDVSHISDRAFWDVLEVSQAPVIATHSGIRSLCNVPRNMSDSMIKALAARGGVIQIVFYSGFLDEAYNRRAEAVRKKLQPQFKKLKKKYRNNRMAFWNARSELWKKYSPEPPSIDILIDHIDYAVKLAGIDHVGLGSDFDGASSYPKGLEDASGFPLITYHLLKRGYQADAIKKILGGNLLRIFSEVEAFKEKN